MQENCMVPSYGEKFQPKFTNLIISMQKRYKASKKLGGGEYFKN